MQSRKSGLWVGDERSPQVGKGPRVVDTMGTRVSGE